MCFINVHLSTLTWYTKHAGGFKAYVALKGSKSADGFLDQDVDGLDVVLAKQPTDPIGGHVVPAGKQ